jgi:hypothetical protein
LATTFGKYEVVAELYSTPEGSVFSARPLAGTGRDARDVRERGEGREPARELREIRHAVKVFNPKVLDLDELFWESQAFLERARVQQRAADAGKGRWAPVYDSSGRWSRD